MVGGTSVLLTNRFGSVYSVALMSRSRAYTVTIPNVDASWWLMKFSVLFEGTNVVYSAKQLEKSPKTGMIHIQGYFYLKSATTLSALIKKHPGPHFEVAQGSPEQNQVYCTKKETRVDGTQSVEYGVLPRQGKRTDIDGAIDDINEGIAMKEVALEHPKTYVKFYKGLNAYRSLTKFDERDFKTEGVFLYGPTYSGKSYHAKNVLAKDKSVYYLTEANMSQKICYWDNYEQQEVVIINEFYGWFPMNLFLNLLDESPF